MIAGINSGKVTDWLIANVAGLTPPFEFTLIAGGHSNLTYRADDAKGRSIVLRRPPLGHVLESAHDMGREYKIISALSNSCVPVAPALGLCSDSAVNDAPFYVMAYVDGLVLHDRAAAEELTAKARNDLGLHVVDVLAGLHKLDPDKVGLGDLGRKEAYLSRQINRWTKQWVASKTHEISEMEKVGVLLAERMPEQVGFAIVHGDYRLGNMMVEPGRILAVLDWELCTLGDPLADIGYLMNSWTLPEDGTEELGPTTAGGFPSREVLCERYSKETGRDLSGINYYRAFSHWRLAAIGQGVYKRYLMGAMGENRGMDLETYKASVRNRAIAALQLLES